MDLSYISLHKDPSTWTLMAAFLQIVNINGNNRDESANYGTGMYMRGLCIYLLKRTRETYRSWSAPCPHSVVKWKQPLVEHGIFSSLPTKKTAWLLPRFSGSSPLLHPPPCQAHITDQDWGWVPPRQRQEEARQKERRGRRGIRVRRSSFKGRVGGKSGSPRVWESLGNWEKERRP